MRSRGSGTLTRIVVSFLAMILLVACGGQDPRREILSVHTCSTDLLEYEGSYYTGTAFKFAPIDRSTGHFPTAYRFPAERLQVSKPYPLENAEPPFYVVVIDAGRRETLPHRGVLGWLEENIAPTGHPYPTASMPGYDPQVGTINLPVLNPLYPNRQGIDRFFKDSFEAMGAFEKVQVISQEEFEHIVRRAEAKRRVPERDRAHHIETALEALKKRHAAGAIDDDAYMRIQRELVAELIATGAKTVGQGAYFTTPTAIQDIQNRYSDHMIAAFLVKRYGRRLLLELTVLDPASGVPIFSAYNEALWQSGTMARPGWDQCVIYPLFNIFIDWVNENSN